MKESIQPIRILKPGQCIKCQRPLHIAISEQTECIVNEMGIPVSLEVTYSTITGFCLNCKQRYSMLRKGLSFVPDIRFFRDENTQCPNPKIVFGEVKENPFNK